MNIIICGDTGEGKTTLSKLIKKCLYTEGFIVINHDADKDINEDHQEKRINALVNKKEIINIYTIQNQRISL